MAGISKLEAARQQLDCAIRLPDTEDLAAHTLAYAAYGLLRDLLGPGATVKVLRKLKKQLSLQDVPEFLKHAECYPEAILKEHSANTAHLTIRLAILLWEEHGQGQTDAMRDFCKRRDPYKPGYRHSAALEEIERGRMPEPGMLAAAPSTSDLITRGPRRRGSNPR
jgi:hypothetical protein